MDRSNRLNLGTGTELNRRSDSTAGQDMHTRAVDENFHTYQRLDNIVCLATFAACSVCPSIHTMLLESCTAILPIGPPMANSCTASLFCPQDFARCSDTNGSNGHFTVFNQRDVRTVERNVRSERPCSADGIDQPIGLTFQWSSGAFLSDNRPIRECSDELLRIASSQARSVSVTRSIPTFEVIRSAPARESAIFWAIPAARIAVSVTDLKCTPLRAH